MNNHNKGLIKTEFTQLNYELCVLRQHFTTFKEIYGNIVDKWLIKNLNETLLVMNNMLSNFNVIDVGDTTLKINLADFTTRNIYFCNVCRRDISNQIMVLQSHVHTKEHKNKLMLYNQTSKVASNSGQTDKDNIYKQPSNLSVNEMNIASINKSLSTLVFNSTLTKNVPPQPSTSKQIPPVGLLVGQPLIKLPNFSNKSDFKEEICSFKNVKTTKPCKTEIDQMNSATKELLQTNLEKTVNHLLAEVNNINFSDSLAIKNSLKEAISPHFKYVDVYPFGSRENGTGTASTDLDVYVDIDHSYHGVGIENKHIILERLQKVIEILEAKSDEWINIRKVNARIPIIKIFNQIEGIDCDISFSSGLGCCNTELIKYLINLQPIFRKMIIFLKRWLKSTALNLYINNYTLILLILFYLQRRYLLPPIEKLQKNLDPLEIGPWNGGFIQKTATELKLNRTENAVRQIIGFFDYYSSHDLFYNNTLCLYLGRAVPNSDIKQLSNVSLKRYNDFAEQYKDQTEFLFKFEYMNIQDPFDLANNTAKMVPLNICRKFVNLAKASFEILSK